MEIVLLLVLPVPMQMHQVYVNHALLLVPPVLLIRLSAQLAK